VTLAAGSRLGPYEIVALLGAGGMGEVYRARDPRLSREVAVKVLSSQRMTTPEARERFEREARTISQLNHPNVCVLHDVGREGDAEYLVMELVEGETLSDRLGRGALPFETALRIGAEIAAALGAAHAKGIVHRDLKPGNVMLTRSGVKLLDFGLARAFDSGGPSGGLTEAATVGKALTAEGTIVGTLAYMAPEQLEGKELDPRTDIFALGAVLYEMLTGKRAFSGSSSATVISAILTSDPPPVSAAIPISPPDLDRLVHLCLAKDPADRWQSAHDVELQLKAIASGSGTRPAVAAPRRRSAALPWLVAAGCAALAAVAALRGRPPKVDASTTIRFSVPPPPGARFVANTVENSVYALSPDGAMLAFVAYTVDGGRLWVRRLSELEAKPIAGTEGARTLFWSPDSRSIGFASEDKLRRISVEGGTPVTICAVPPGIGLSATWGSAGDIVFAGVQGESVYRVPASGGTPARVLEADHEKEGRLNWPWFLPDGRRFFYLARSLAGTSRVMLFEPGKPSTEIMAEASRVQYAEPGLLFFARDGALLARRFDDRSGRVSGEAIPVVAHVSYFASSGYAAFTVSRSGTVALHSGLDVNRLAWFDRSGRPLGNVGPPGEYLEVRFSPDGKRVYFARARPTTGAYGIWFADVETSTESPLSPGPDTEIGPLVLPGGSAMLYSAVRGRSPQLVRQDLATGKVEEFLPFGTFQFAHDVTPDGNTLLFAERGEEKGVFDLWTVPLSGGGKPTPFVRSAANKTDARFSPDGRFVSYIAEEPGGSAIYVAPYPGPGEKVRVTPRGAVALRWTRAGDLLFVSDDGHLVSIPVRTIPVLQIGKPVDLFAMPEKAIWPTFDVSPDGQRVLAIVPEVQAEELPLDVIVNWAPAAAR
jgi:eukaryotic-like serine/threonine-protein kinase